MIHVIAKNIQMKYAKKPEEIMADTMAIVLQISHYMKITLVLLKAVEKEIAYMSQFPIVALRLRNLECVMIHVTAINILTKYAKLMTKMNSQITKAIVWQTSHYMKTTLVQQKVVEMIVLKWLHLTVGLRPCR